MGTWHLYIHVRRRFSLPHPAVDTGIRLMILQSPDATPELRETSIIRYPRKRGHYIRAHSVPLVTTKMMFPLVKKNINDITCSVHPAGFVHRHRSRCRFSINYPMLHYGSGSTCLYPLVWRRW